jgi:hypothetical protein
MAAGDRLGEIIKVEEVKDGLQITVLFDDDDKLATALQILKNLDRTYASIDAEHLMIGIATSEFYDGP